MPESEQAVTGIAEHVRRGDQPQPDHDFGHLLPTLQRHILQLGEAEYEDADRKRIQDHEAAFRIDKFTACLDGKPRRQHDQHAKQHAAPVFPCSMSAEKPKVRHCKPPLKRGIRLRLASMTLRLSGDRSGRIGGVCLVFQVGNPRPSDKAEPRFFVAEAAPSLGPPPPCPPPPETTEPPPPSANPPPPP